MKCLLILALSPALGACAWQGHLVQDQAVPTNASELIAKARSYAAEYIDGLPNFLCVQTTTHSIAGRKGVRWPIRANANTTRSVTAARKRAAGTRAFAEKAKGPITSVKAAVGGTAARLL